MCDDVVDLQTDGLVWVVDSADRRRLDDCKRELGQLLTQEVCACVYTIAPLSRVGVQHDAHVVLAVCLLCLVLG